MLDLAVAYCFSPTVAAMQDGHQVVLGGNLNEFLAIDMRTVTPEILEALNLVGQRRPLGAIIERTAEPHRTNFLRLLELLVQRGHVEPTHAKADAIARCGEQAVDYERFDRQINLFKHACGTYDGALRVQSALTAARVSLIGLGGCGSYIFYTLSAMGVGRIRAFEFDHVERSNLSRQVLYTHADIGRRKIDVAAERAPLISPTTTFEFYDKQLLSVEDCKEAFSDVDLVIAAADAPRPEFYRTLNAACFTYGTPAMYAGSMTTNGVIGPLLVPGKTRCFMCIRNLDERPKEFNYPFVNATIDAYMTTLIDPYNAAAGSLAALEAVKFLTGFQPCRIVGRRIIISFDDYHLHPDTPVRTGPCPICN